MFSPSRFLKLTGVLLTAAALSVVYIGTQTEVVVRDGAQERRVRTHATTVGEALRKARIDVRPEDLVVPPLGSVIETDLTITIERSTPVEIVIGNLTRVVYTRRTSVGAILAEAGLSLGPSDTVLADGELMSAAMLAEVRPLAPGNIRLVRAIPIAVIDGGERRDLTSAAQTVGEALWEASIVTYLADGISPGYDTPLIPGLEIVISRSRAVSVLVDGQTLRTRTHRERVGDLLADVGVTLTGADYTTPALEAPIPAEGSIRVVRVAEQIVTEQTPIPYGTLTQGLPDLEIDQTTLVQPGANGVQARQVRVRYEDGKEVARTVEGEWVQTEPTPRIVGYGTQIVVRTLDTPDGPIEYWRAVTMYATSYSPARSGTPATAPWYGLTRSGKRLQKGMAAVDLSVMPLGTPLYVPGYGYATAEDTGGGVRGLIIDLGYEDHNYESWHQNVTVYFLTPVPPADQITWVLP